jgi:hypothetical protein
MTKDPALNVAGACDRPEAIIVGRSGLYPTRTTHGNATARNATARNATARNASAPGFGVGFSP